MDRYLYEETRLNMVRRARNFAVASLSCSIILFNFPPLAIVLGFFAILFAFLSKGYRVKMDKEAVTAVKFALAGIVIGCGVFFAYIYRFATDEEYRNLITSDMDSSVYAETYKDAYGVMPSEIINRYFGGGTDE